MAFSDVANIVKKNTALVFSNAIGITHSGGSVRHPLPFQCDLLLTHLQDLYSSINNRDKIFDVMARTWAQQKAHDGNPKVQNSFKKERNAQKPSPDESQHGNRSSMDSDPRPALRLGKSFEEPVTETLDITSPELDRSKEELKPPAPIQLKKTGTPPLSVREIREDDDSFLMEEGGIATSSGTDPIRRHPQSERKRAQAPISQARKLSQPFNLSDLESGAREKPLDLAVLRSDSKSRENLKLPKASGVPKETKAEAPEAPVEAPRPSGAVKSHLPVEGTPVVDAVFLNVTVSELYHKLMANVDFWRYVFKEQENWNIVVPPMSPSNEEPTSLYSRKCTFMTPIKGAPMGPKETRVIQTQRISCPSET